MLNKVLIASLLSFLSLQGPRTVAQTSTAGAPQLQRSTLSCRLQVRADSMAEAKSVTDEILLPVASQDKHRSRDIIAAHSDVIDAFGRNPRLHFATIAPDRDGKVPLLLTFVGNKKGMSLQSNFEEAGFSGEIESYENGFTLVHPDVMAPDFPGLYVNFVANDQRLPSDHRARISIYCGRSYL